MSENANLVHTVAFTRKVNDGNYGSTEATMWLQFDTPLGADPAAIIEQAMDRFAAGKAIVFDQLGIEYHIVDGIIVENLDVAVSQAKTERAVKAGFTEVAHAVLVDGAHADAHENVFGTGGGERDPEKVGAQGVGPTPPYDPKTKDAGERKLNSQWAKARYETHPDEFWNNKSKKASGQFSETSPDFTHKDTRVGFWA